MIKMRRIKARLAFILFVLAAVFTVLGGRVFYLKTVHGSQYETESRTQQISRYDEMISPNRGTIVDRNNQPLALSTTVYNIVMDSRVLQELGKTESGKKTQETTLSALSSVLNIDRSTLDEYLQLDTSWKVLAKKQPKEVKEQLESAGVKGVVFQKDTQRKYPSGVMASQVIGFIRGDTSMGLEKEYNTEMSGVPGRSFITYDGTEGAVNQEIPAQDGDTIVTTIDYQIQQFAQEAANQAMADYNAEYTAALVMNPNTGEIVAMAQTPTFDLNNPAKPIGIDDATWNAMDEKTQYEYLNKTWKNFSISDTYEPGSIFKPVVVAAALEQGIISPNSTYYCGGKKKVADREIACHLRSGHGQETLEDVIANSCNVGMMDIAEKMGASAMYNCQKDFGIGSLTGVDLPGETDASALMYSEDKIRSTELATMSFGQSFNTTTLQAATALCAVINGGNILKPYVVSRVLDENGAIVKEAKPEIIRKVISKETSDAVRKYMIATVDHGTGKKAKIEGYTIGGKTGTAQQGNRDKGIYTVSYAAFFPADNPQYLVLTVIHHPESYADGVTTAAPMIKGLMEKIIKYKNIEPDTTVSNTSSSNEKKTVDVPDYTGNSLFDVLYDLDAHNLQYEIVGSGNSVVNQMPHGGTTVDEGSKVLIYVEKGEGETGNKVVPDVTGKTYSEAVKEITAAGLSAVTENEDESGVVVKTDPAHGITVDEGSEVKIYLGDKQDETTDESKTDNTQENQSQ